MCTVLCLHACLNTIRGHQISTEKIKVASSPYWDQINSVCNHICKYSQTIPRTYWCVINNCVDDLIELPNSVNLGNLQGILKENLLAPLRRLGFNYVHVKLLSSLLQKKNESPQMML